MPPAGPLPPSPPTHTPAIKGWCPGALQPMESADGLVVRVRPPLGRLTLRQAARLARLARTHGSGVLELSSRANVQLRGIRGERHPGVLRALAGCGLLLDTDVRSERRRNVIVDPLHRAGDGVLELAEALLQALASVDDALDFLPAKFGWSIDGGHGSALRSVSADIRFERAAHSHGEGEGDPPVWRIQPDGCAWAMVAAGPAQATAAGVALARWFAGRCRLRQVEGIRPGRLAACAREMERLAAPVMPAAIAAGRPEHAKPADHPAPWPPGLPAGVLWRPAQAGAATAAAEPAAHPGPVAGAGWLVGAPLGRLSAQALSQLVQGLRQPGGSYAEPGLRVTPWRMLLIEHPVDGSTELPARWSQGGLNDAGHWITHADDARLRVSACTGAPGCPQGQATTLDLALALAPQVPKGAHLHVSGCAKGCARQAPATVTLRAEPSAGGALFSVVRQGTANGQASERHEAAAVQDNPRLLFAD